MIKDNVVSGKWWVLDFGYLQLVDVWGSDEGIIEAARMSTNKGFQGWGPKLCDCSLPGDTTGKPFCKKCGGSGQMPGDEKLLRYLWEHKHQTPFEMAGATFEVKAPLMVFREWHRHRTQSYNEMSARYVEMPDEYYLPSVDRLEGGKQSMENKQGSEIGFSRRAATEKQYQLERVYEACRYTYVNLIRGGVAKELARLALPMYAQYSRMRASANLRNWLAFLTLREAAGAQWEIRQYAHAVSSCLAERFPRTHALYLESKPT